MINHDKSVPADQVSVVSSSVKSISSIIPLKCTSSPATWPIIARLSSRDRRWSEGLEFGNFQTWHVDLTFHELGWRSWNSKQGQPQWFGTLGHFWQPYRPWWSERYVSVNDIYVNAHAGKCGGQCTIHRTIYWRTTWYCMNPNIILIYSHHTDQESYTCSWLRNTTPVILNTECVCIHIHIYI